jgi:hypothetical protein
VPDVISDLVADITTKLETITAIKDKIIYMFDSNDLVTERTKIGTPAIGVVYNSMRGHGAGDKKQGHHGLAATVTMDIYILGGDQCVEKISKVTGVKMATTEFLEQIRDAIKLTKPQTGTGASQVPLPKAQRLWVFVLESPVEIGDELISYVQRWETKVLLTS